MLAQAAVLSQQRGLKQQQWASSGADPGPDRSQATFMLSDDHHSSAWLAPSSCAQPTSTAATDHYSHVCEVSTDSAFSDQEPLACTELLCPTESFDPQQAGAARERERGAQQPGGSASSSLTLVCRPTLVGAQVQEVRETIRNEMRREAETQPVVYFKRHLFLAKEARVAAVSWAVQVVDQFRIEQETLFLAISYLDRFLSVTQDVVHMEGLHLATLACLSLAAKQTEVTQPSTGEWAWLAQPNAWGTKEHLARMEWIVMEMLEWRGCTPTAWWFLHLFCYGLAICPANAICTSAYLLELSLMDPGCLGLSYSSLAAAAVMLSHTPPAQAVTQPPSSPPRTPLATTWDHHQQQQPQPQQQAPGEPADASALPVVTIHMLLELAPELNLHQVQDACRALAELHTRASVLPAAPPDQALEGLALARAKYSQELWHRVAAPDVVQPLNLQGTLERF